MKKTLFATGLFLVACTSTFAAKGEFTLTGKLDSLPDNTKMVLLDYFSATPSKQIRSSFFQATRARLIVGPKRSWLLAGSRMKAAGVRNLNFIFSTMFHLKMGSTWPVIRWILSKRTGIMPREGMATLSRSMAVTMPSRRKISFTTSAPKCLSRWKNWASR